MKKIQCIKCNEKWIVEDDKPPKLQVCPFCGVNLWEKAIVSDLDNTSIENALFNIIRYSDIDVLKQKSRVIGMLSDLTKGMDKEIRIISRAYNQDVANLVYDAFISDEAASQSGLKRIKHSLIEDEGFAESWASFFVESIQKCIRLHKGADSKKQNVMISEFVVSAIPQPTLQKEKMESSTEGFDNRLSSAPTHVKSTSAETIKSTGVKTTVEPVKTPGKSVYEMENGGRILKIKSFGDDFRISWDQKDIIEKVIIEEGITETSLSAFANCKNLKEVILPSTLTKVGYSSFENCDSLTTINFPTGLKTVAGKAFNNCTRLRNIVLPQTVKYIGDSAFSGYKGNTIYVNQGCVICPGNYSVKTR